MSFNNNVNDNKVLFGFWTQAVPLKAGSFVFGAIFGIWGLSPQAPLVLAP